MGEGVKRTGIAVLLRRALRYDEASAFFTDGAVPVAAADKEYLP